MEAVASLPRGAVAARLENRFNRARSAAERASMRAVSKTVAEWKSLADKERICRGLDHVAATGADPSTPLSEDALKKWAELATLPARWEQALTARRDAALQALADEGSAAAYLARTQKSADVRRMWLVEIERALELPTPPEPQEERRALQVRQLRERFKRDAGAAPETPEAKARWDERFDQQRLDRISCARCGEGRYRTRPVMPPPGSFTTSWRKRQVIISRRACTVSSLISRAHHPGCCAATPPPGGGGEISMQRERVRETRSVQ